MGGMRSIMTIGLIASDPQAVPEVSSSSPRFSSAGLHSKGDDPADHDPNDPAIMVWLMCAGKDGAGMVRPMGLSGAESTSPRIAGKAGICRKASTKFGKLN